MAGVSKLSGSHKCLAVLTKLLILAVSVSTCVAIANAIDDDDYADESRDVSLRGHRHQQQQQQQQQQAFNFDNLQRLRAKFQQDAHYRNNKARNGNNRNLYRAGGGRGSSSRDDDKNSAQKNQNQNQNQNDNQPKFGEMEFYDELESSMPYGIQNVRRDLTSRSTRSQMHLHKPKTTFQSLCPSRRTVIPLETVSFEYRPDHYEEVTCFHSYAPSRDYMSETNKVCSEAGFTCIQLNRTVYLTRRAKGTECWESETRIVPSGCECMWPKHTFGDIITYH